MIFILLNKNSKDEMYLNPEHISMIQESTDGKAFITLVNNKVLYPKETVKQVLEMIPAE